MSNNYFLSYLTYRLYLVTLDITDSFHSSFCISSHFHKKTLFLYYKYYKILFILIILQIIAIYIYYIISIIFVYVFLFFANNMQTIWYVFIFMFTCPISESINITDFFHNSFCTFCHFHKDMVHFYQLFFHFLQLVLFLHYHLH